MEDADAEWAGWRAVATWYHGFFTGIVLSTVARRGAADAARLLFAVFRRQHHEKFLSSLGKLGLDGLPDAVKAAGYHYLSNRIGGVKVEFMRESDRKAWVRFPPPRWIWNGVAICAIPSEVSAAVLAGWYAENGPSLGNPRLGFVCTKMTVDGQAGLEGYFEEHDFDLTEAQRLRFAPEEDAPRFDPAAAPELPAGQWPQARLRRAHRGYAMEYVRSTLPEATRLFGASQAVELLGLAGRLVGMQLYEQTASALGGFAADAAGFADFMVALAVTQGDAAVRVGAAGVRQGSIRLLTGLDDPSIFDAWSGLLEGALMAHDRHLRLELLHRPDRGDAGYEWRIV